MAALAFLAGSVSAAVVNQLILPKLQSSSDTGIIRAQDDDKVDLGSSSYEFRNAYIDGTAYIDTLSVGAITLAKQTTVTPSYVAGITTSTIVLPVSSGYVVVASTGGDVAINTVGTAPTISTTTYSAGTYLIISSTSTDQGVTFTEGATECLYLGAATRTVGLSDTLMLMFDGYFWVELSFTEN